MSKDNKEKVESTEEELDIAEAEESEELDVLEEDAEELEELDVLEADAEELEEELLEEELDEEVLEIEEGEPFDDMEEGKKKSKKGILIALCSILGVLLVVYLGISVYFMSHFYFNTTINGVDQALKTVDQVEEYMKTQVDGYSLTLKTSDGGAEVISGDSISMEYKEGEELQQLLDAQNAFLWPVSLLEAPEIEAAIGVSYDEAQLQSVIAELACMQEENQEQPVSSKPEYNGTEFVPKEETVGSKVDEETLAEKIAQYLNGFVAELDMTEEECYEKPKYVSDSPEVLEACETMNSYLNGTITYELGSNNEVIDKELISEWITTNSDMEVKFRTKKIKAYVAELAEKYDTYQTTRKFTSGNGDTVKVSGGSYGWLIDQDAEYKAIKANIKSGEPVEREPEYTRRAASHDGNEWGDTYVEVDLTNQRVYLFVDGKVILDKPCVTGNVNKGWYTPQGVYSIAYCTTNVTLRGPKNDEGEYEWESPVTFWMPFNGSIGLHDASWQNAFGDPQGYTYSGSRGCVNLQYNTAETIYNNVTAGTPVIVHY